MADLPTQTEQELENLNQAILNFTANPIEEISAFGRSHRITSLRQLYNLRAQAEHRLSQEKRKARQAEGKPAGGRVRRRFI